MNGLLTDRVVVVVGGAGLLGQSFVRGIVDERGIAIVADIDLHAAQAVVTDVTGAVPGAGEAGSRAASAPVDVTDQGSLDALIDSVAEMYGRIDAVVNTAYPRNHRYGRRLEDVTYPDFCENVSLHLGGYFLVAQRFARFFSSRRRGNIISMASIYGSTVPRFEIYAGTAMTMPVEYAAIKAGVIQLTRYFAQYFKGQEIRVNSISPGGILDEQPREFVEAYNRYGASKGMLAPSDVVGALLFLLSDMSAHVTGQNLVVDDGWSL